MSFATSQSIGKTRYQTLLKRGHGKNDPPLREQPLEPPCEPTAWFLPDVLRKLETDSELVEKRVYGAGLAPWNSYFDRLGFLVSPLPPPVDFALMVDAIDLLHTTPGIAHFCIATADRDFTPLVAKLRARGMHVTGIAQGPVASALRMACDQFLSLDDFSNAALSSAAIPEIVAAIQRIPSGDGWVDHSLLAARLRAGGFDARGFGKSTVIEIIEALPDAFEVRPTSRVEGPVSVRLKATREI